MFRGFLSGTCFNIRSRTDEYRRCGTAGDLFWKISSAVVLQHFSACDIIYHFVFYQFKGKCGTADLRSIDSDFNRCGAETRKETIE